MPCLILMLNRPTLNFLCFLFFSLALCVHTHTHKHFSLLLLLTHEKNKKKNIGFVQTRLFFTVIKIVVLYTRYHTTTTPKTARSMFLRDDPLLPTTQEMRVVMVAVCLDFLVNLTCIDLHIIHNKSCNVFRCLMNRLDRIKIYLLGHP